MKQQNHQLDHLPAYLVKINTSAFRSKGNSVMQRAKDEYLPKYWEKLHMDQKKIGPSCEDRLTSLSTNQIDRIVDMQKIQYALQYKKKKLTEPSFIFQTSNPNRHSNTYKACFIAKINHIAIKRNILPERADLGIFVGEDSGNIQNKSTPVSFKYKKQYSIDKTDRKRSRTQHIQDDDVKSIASIKDELEVFEENLKKSKKAKVEFRCRKRTEFPMSVTKKWFYGLTDTYINQRQQDDSEPPLSRSASIDISSQLTLAASHSSKKKYNKSQSTGLSDSRPLTRQPMQKYKTPRVVTLQ